MAGTAFPGVSPANVQLSNGIMSCCSRSSPWQQDRHHGRRTVWPPWRLTQNPAGRCRQWMQSWTVRGGRPGIAPLRRRGAEPVRFDPEPGLRGPGKGLRYEAAELVRCVREGLTESRALPLDETVSIMETLDAIRADAAAGATRNKRRAIPAAVLDMIKLLCPVSPLSETLHMIYSPNARRSI